MIIRFITMEAPPMRYIGAEIYDVNLAKELKKAGHEIIWEVIDSDDSWSYEGIVFNDNLDINADVLITHSDMLEYALRSPEKYKIGITHNNATETLKQAASPIWDLVICNSFYQETLIKGDSKKIVINPSVNGRAKKVSQGEKVMLVNAIIQKGASELYTLAYNLPDTQFIVVEGGWGKQEETLKHFPNIEWIPQQKNLDDIFPQAKILLGLSNKYESWLMVATEALAYGIPTITYNDNLGILENIGSTGFSASRNGLYDVKRAIETLRPSQANIEYYKQYKIKVKAQIKSFIKELESELSNGDNNTTI